MSEPNFDPQEALAPYLKLVNDTPALLSILYDIDLLPEQIRSPVNAARMVAFCEVFRRLPPEAVDSLLAAPELQQEPEGE